MRQANQISNLPKMLTIRECSKTGILTEHALRLMLKQGILPHVKIGVKTLVNFNLLVEQLNSLRSKSN